MIIGVGAMFRNRTLLSRLLWGGLCKHELACVNGLVDGLVKDDIVPPSPGQDVEVEVGVEVHEDDDEDAPIVTDVARTKATTKRAPGLTMSLPTHLS